MGHPVTQFQILAKNPQTAAEFYGKLFGWTFNADNALGYQVINTQSKSGIQGGIWPAPPEAQALVQLFVEVPDVKATVELVGKLNGTVVIEPQTLPDGDEMAVILDTEGIPFGLFQAAKRD